MAQAANLLSASRFIFAALWIAATFSGRHTALLLVPLALAAALSDFADGRISRLTGSVSGFGRWLDSVADIVFILAALGCEARLRAIPLYLPALIAISFAQYAADSVVIARSTVPLASRLGHWGGIVNYALVIMLGFAPALPWLAGAVRTLAPLLAIYWLAAISERLLSYRWRPA